ncbi:MAG TPA: hypothetical protein VH370_20175 [Humisphaera sp.]|jgi:glycine/D-amino acid oxidase-like deaminating enzyme|nr:hypothetical protein [Humisphaera sp.]
MAQAIVVTLEKTLPDPAPLAAYTKAAGGKSLAREADRLDFASRKCKVAAISSMLSESQAALRAKLEADGFDPAKIRLPAEQWFDPGEGSKIVRALIEHVTANLNDFKQPNPILRDLKAVAELLAAAQAAGMRFHFTKVEL